MNWKECAIQRLKQIPYMEQSLKSIPMELHRLELEASAIGGAGPIPSGPVSHRGRENRFLNNCMQRQELRWQLQDARLWLESTRQALENLTPNQQQLLQQLYIHPVKDAVEQLCWQLGLERSSIYRHRDKALEAFATSLYGPVRKLPA